MEGIRRLRFRPAFLPARGYGPDVSIHQHHGHARDARKIHRPNRDRYHQLCIQQAVYLSEKEKMNALRGRLQIIKSSDQPEFHRAFLTNWLKLFYQ